MALTARKVATARKPGRYRDDAVPGLYVQITKAGVKSWLLRYELNGKERWHGLGPCHTVSLQQARIRAREARLLILDNKDPIEAKREAKAKALLEANRTKTFEWCAREFTAQIEGAYRNERSRKQFLDSFEVYVFPLIGRLSVADIDRPEVLQVLEQKHARHSGKTLWTAVPTTADRVRNRLERVISWAVVRGYRNAGPNPAQWKDNLEHALPAINGKSGMGSTFEETHHAALPWLDIPGFMARLRAREGIVPRALEFCILTATRTGDVLKANWDQIDLSATLWTIPIGKNGRSHRVPLSNRAVEILQNLPRHRGNEKIFIGTGKNGAIGKDAMMTELSRLVPAGTATVHGMRSSFKDWCSESTAYPNVVSEMALAHAIGNTVEAAYRRGDLFEKRRKLMDAWSNYCAMPPSTKEYRSVVVLRENPK